MAKSASALKADGQSHPRHVSFGPKGDLRRVARMRPLRARSGRAPLAPQPDAPKAVSRQMKPDFAAGNRSNRDAHPWQ